MSGRILIVDAVASNRIVHRARLSAGLYDPVLAHDGKGCLAEVLGVPAALRPDLVLLSLDLPDMPGHEVVRQMRADPRGRHVPVIGLAAVGDAMARQAALAAGVDAVIVTPVLDRLLLARVRNLLRSRSDLAGDGTMAESGFADPAAAFDMPGVVAVVPAIAGDLACAGYGSSVLDDLSRHLSDRLIPVSRNQSLADPTSQATVADIFILQSPDAASEATLRLLSELKSHHGTRHAVICLLDSGGRPEAAAMAYDLDADDVVGPEVSSAELALRLRCLLRRKRAADRRRSRIETDLRLAMIDPLTGLFNRRYAGPKLAAIAARAVETGGPYAVMVVDIDRFKRVNDLHGHASGDAVLVEVARRLTGSLREGDLLARIGGEEFMVVLPDTNRKAAEAVAARLCAAIEEHPFRLPSGGLLSVTVSIGVTVALGALRADRVVEQADLALLDSKGLGRNRVTFRLTAA